jgi:hypothetical protein
MALLCGWSITGMATQEGPIHMVDPQDVQTPKTWVSSQRRCRNCHWWFDRAGDGQSKMRVCILHTGMRGEKAAKMKLGGTKAIETAEDFGCTEWIKDERPKSA